MSSSFDTTSICVDGNTIGYINALVTNTIRDSYSREAHVNQQTDMAMSDSVDPYSFYSAGGTTTANFVV